jgi:DNA-binding NarL/FixJ family response regulator
MRGEILVVHGSPAFHDELQRQVPEVVLERARTARDAAVSLAARRWSGLVTSASLPDASGFVLAHYARERDPDLPILLCAATDDVRLANRAQLLHAQIAFEPFIAGNVSAFAALARRRSGLRASRIHDIVDSIGSAWRLSPQERHVVELASYGVSREGICAELSVTRNTLKTVVARILRKADCADLNQVVRAALDRAAFG